MPIDFPSNPQINDTYTSGNTTWQFNGSVWNVVSSVSQVAVPNAFNNISVSGQDSIVADSINDTINLIAGTNITITTSAISDSITINSEGGGEVAEQNLWATISGDIGATTANTTTDTLTIAGGTSISTSITGDILTISYTGDVGGAAGNLTELTDVARASLNVSDIYLPAITKLNVSNSGASAYLFDQYSGTNPRLYVLSGTTIAFDLNNAQGHPFELQNNSLNPLTSDLIHVANNGAISTNSAAQGKDSGVLYWKIPADSSGTFAYQCQVHAAMVGTITVKNIALI